MPQTLTLTAVDLPGTLDIPDNTDLADENSIEQFAQPLGDGIKAVQQQLATLSQYSVPATAIAWAHRLSLRGAIGSGWFQFKMMSGRPLWAQGTSGETLTCSIADEMDINPNLAYVQIDVQGQPGHAGLPSGMPTLRLVRWANGTGASFGSARTVIATVTDTAPNVTAYELVHTLQLTPGIVLDQNYEYAIELIGESGTNSLNNLVIGNARLLFGA